MTAEDKSFPLGLFWGQKDVKAGNLRRFHVSQQVSHTHAPAKATSTTLFTNTFEPSSGNRFLLNASAVQSKAESHRGVCTPEMLSQHMADFFPPPIMSKVTH